VIERWQSVRRTTPTAVYVATGVSWLAAVFWVVIGNVIVRETLAGKLAQQIDRLPPLLAKPIFVLCWGLFFLGWTVPLVFGVRRVFRRTGDGVSE
jgi:hypothetical protein